MIRRQFIKLLGGAAVAWPRTARAQLEPAMPVLGWLSTRNANADAPVLPAFRQGLKETGFVEGRNLAIEFRWANNQLDRLPDMATRPAGSASHRFRQWRVR
jgi:putative ABC transport system substrate-binding protein